MSVLLDYSFLTVAIGACVLAMCASVVGTISVLSKQSLIGDTLAHASYPGVILAYMLTQNREPMTLMFGAVFSGYISYYLVHFLTSYFKHSYVNALTIVSSSFFGIGMVLNQFVQGNKQFSKAAQAGLKNYLFGQAAFIKESDIWLIISVSVIIFILFIWHYQGFKLYLSDRVFAQLQGVNIKLLKHISTFMIIILISVGLKVVGAILMSSFFVAPATAGILAHKKFKGSLLVAMLLGVSCAFVGTLLSSHISGLSTGPAIIVCMSLVTFTLFILTRNNHDERGDA